MIGIDSLSWYKLITFLKKGWSDLVIDILKGDNFFITYEVKVELEHRYPSFKHLFERVALLPKIEIDFTSYQLKGFDYADASLIEYSIRKNYFIITEDHLMITEGIMKNKNIMQLGDYLGVLLVQDRLSKKEFYQLVKILRKMKNITKMKEKHLLNLR